MTNTSKLASLMAASILVSTVMGQVSDYRVWSSFVYVQAGEKTPATLGTTIQLTPLGAEQMYAAGQYLRSQYLKQGGLAQIESLDATDPSPLVSTLTLDSQSTSASAQAFLQGMWPPTTNSSQVSGTLANGTSVSGPLDGMKYAKITASSANEVDSIYVDGDGACRGFQDWSASITQIKDFVANQEESRSTYFSLRSFLDPVIPESEQTLVNAKVIYDSITYMTAYNSSIAGQISGMPGILARLRHYADVQQAAYYGSLDASNPYNRVPLAGSKSSISTIAGSTLASRILAYFATMPSFSTSVSPLSITVGDHSPVLSLFALTKLTDIDSSFSSVPQPGSVMVFELVSLASINSTSSVLPSASDLSIRFRFRNGTGIESLPNVTSGSDLTTFPLFGSNSSVMPFSLFEMAVQPVAIASPGDWCYQCASDALFCAGWNSSLVSTRYATASSSSGTTAHISLPTAGIIGGVLALLLAGIVAATASLCFGIRAVREGGPIWRRDGSSARNSRPGQPRSPRATSTAASSPKSAVVVEKEDAAGHEREGSWELKKPSATTPSTTTESSGGYDMFPKPPSRDRYHGQAFESRRNYNYGGEDAAEDDLDHYAGPTMPRETV